MQKALRRSLEAVTVNAPLEDAFAVTAVHSDGIPAGGSSVSGLPPQTRKPFSISVHRRTELAVLPSGYVLNTPVHVIPGKHVAQLMRGEISGFSKHSRLRLRKVLISTRSKDDLPRWDLTLTVPGEVISPDAWRELFHLFQVKVNRIGSGLIWRIELQERQQPHLHILLFADDKNASLVKVAWEQSVRSLGEYDHIIKTGKNQGQVMHCSSRMALPGADSHCACLKEDDGGYGWFRYLADHTSKTKQAQMGWQGRQWGIIGKRYLSKNGFTEKFELEDKEVIVITRWIKRLTRSWSMRGRRGESVFFGRGETIKRMLFFIRA